jgi:hypothetical protein
MKNRKLVYSLAVASAVSLTLLGVEVGRAATAVPPNTIHACVNSTTHVLSNVYTNPNSNVTCPTGSYRVIWPNGPATAGPTGLDVITIYESGGDSTGASLASCPSDHPYAIGGGGVSTTSTDWSNPSSAHLVQSRPINVAAGPTNYSAPNPPTGWFVVGDPLSSGAYVAAYAICAK